MNIGIIGCGNISSTYFEFVPKYKGLKILACADMNPEAAKAAAVKYSVKAMSVDDLLADDSIDIVVNLTIPVAHCKVTCDILEANKHCYSEKPLALNLAEGLKIQKTAKETGKQVGCSPDTYLGGAHQLARSTIDAGTVGQITSGSCHVMSPGMEMWHPNPDFFFQIGGGPILDLGPYYIANLLNLVGPIKRVSAMSNTAQAERTITSQPRAGEKLKVDTPTTLLALLEFENSATVTLSSSWDVWAHRHANMELYGLEGSIYIPDPNFFGGDVLTVKSDQVKHGSPVPKPNIVPDEGHPLGVPNQNHGEFKFANYRGVGLAEMINSIGANREPRCSLARALHTLEVMSAILTSAEKNEFVEINTTCTKPAYFGLEEAQSLLI